MLDRQFSESPCHRVPVSPQQGGAVFGVCQRDVDAGCGKLGQHAVEGGKLFGAVRPLPVAGSVRYREVGEDAFDNQTRELAQRTNESQRLIREDAEPSHAGVHLDVDARGAV